MLITAIYMPRTGTGLPQPSGNGTGALRTLLRSEDDGIPGPLQVSFFLQPRYVKLLGSSPRTRLAASWWSVATL